MQKPILLYTSYILHHPAIGGPYLRIENSIKALSNLYNLYIYCRVNEGAMGGKPASAFYLQYAKKLYFDPISDLSDKMFDFLSRRIRILSPDLYRKELQKFLNYEHTRYLLKLARHLNPDVIWLGYGNNSYPILKGLKLYSNYKVVVDTDSVWSRFILRRLSFINDPLERQKIEAEGKKKVDEEKSGTYLADVTTAVSEVDADYYRAYSKIPDQVKVFSNVIDLDNYIQTPSPPKDFSKPCLYLAGTFFNACPMEDAARWIINQVLPIIWSKKPGVHLYIVGNNSEKFLSDVKDPRITITGYQLNVLPYLSNADVALVPLRFESGTRFKILEAGACKVPIVSTTLGAEGLLVTHEKDLLLADDPLQFASSIIRLLDDRNFALEIAQNLHNLVKERYSLPSLIREGNIILEYLLQSTVI